MSKKRRIAVVYQVAALLVFVIVGFFIYSNTLKSPFILDDNSNICENPHIRLTKLNLKDIAAAGFKSRRSRRPVSNISFALNYYFHQYEIVGYHLINIIIHILTAIFVYLFFKSTLSIPLLRQKYVRYKWIAFLAALFWLVHPVQTQAVTYIVQRMTSLAVMFYILSFLLYVKGRVAGLKKKKSWPWFAGCIIAGILAFSSKEMAATLPIFILLYEWYFFQDLNSRWLRSRLPYVVGVFIFFGLLGLFYLGTSPFERISSSYEDWEFTMGQRLLTQSRVVIYYISLLVYPHPSRLNLDYDFAISHSLTDPLTTLFCIAAIIVFIGLAICIAKRERLFSFCIIWFFGNLVMESSFLRLELVFEHRLYLPSILVSLAIVVLLWRCIKQAPVRIIVFSAVTLLLCGFSYERNSAWRDRVTLWRDCVAKSPKKSRPHNALAKALKAQGKIDEAIRHYHLAIQFGPRNANAYYNLANTLKSQGKVDDAIACYYKAVQINPDFIKAHYNLGNVLRAKGKFDEAIEHYRSVLNLKPDDAEAYGNIGGTLYRKGKLDEAISYYRKAMQLQPDHYEIRCNIGMLLQQQGKIAEAIKEYRQALQINPDYVKAKDLLEAALAKQKEL